METDEREELQSIGELLPKECSSATRALTERERCEKIIERMRGQTAKQKADVYDCQRCNNIGILYSVIEWETPSGETVCDVAQEECSCMNIRRASANMGVDFHKYSFERFEVEKLWQAKMKNRVQEFIKDDGAKMLFIGGKSGCVDCDTEYFNGYEWRRISSYFGEKVLEYDPKTNSARLTQPERWICKDADVLYHIRTSRGSINQVLSADHNFAYVTSKGHMQKKPFAEVKRMHETSIQGFHGLVQTTFNYNGKGIDLTDAQIRLMCAVIADGSFPKRQQQCTVNVKKERKKERMRKLLADCNLKYKEYTRCDGYSRFRFYAPRKEKVFSSIWYNCTSEQLKIVADEVFYWDGSTDGIRKSFFSTEKRNADFVQFALAAAGVRATISIDSHRKKPCYTVQAASGKPYVSMLSPKGKSKVQIQEYKPTDGKMYCFTVDTGYLVLRRNGRIFISGNSGKTHLCTAAFAELLKKRNGIYISWNETVRRLKAVTLDEDTFYEIMKPLQTAEVLYIDDFFKPVKGSTGWITAATEADIKIAFELINYRYNKGSKTLMSSECYITEIMDIDEALGGRIAEMATEKYILQIEDKPENNYRRKGVSYL